MPDTRYAFSIVLVAFFSFFFSSRVYSEIADHHGFGVDTETSVAGCLSCHDGVQAKDAPICTKNCDSLSPHPILKRYPPKGPEGNFASVAEINSRGIRLQDNKIACVSCHDLLNSEKNHPVQCGGSLCAVCHPR